MPGDNIIRAIKKGTGELGGAGLEVELYEGYGPHGVALLIDTLTDNRNRTVNEVRSVLHRRGGSMGTSGCVAYLFHRKGVITVDRDGHDEDTVLEAALEAGAEDMHTSDDSFQIITAPEECETVTLQLEARGLNPSSSEVTMLPSLTVPLTDTHQARSVLRLLDELEELDDVQKVYSNFDIDDELMQQIEEEE
jgi:YebC/PmpR family DNA-binding regulatory protein